jgi:nucleoid-associated protein
MALQHITLLKIQRSDFAGPIELTNASAELDIEGVAYSIFEQAKQQLNKSASKRFGFFDPEADNKQFRGLVKNFDSGTVNFLELANKASSFLQQQFDHSDTPINCTILVATESILEQQYLYFILLPMTEILQAGEDLNPYRSEAIAANRIQFALRLHMQSFIEDDTPKYLTQILSKGAKDLADSFERFSNFREGIDLSAQTSEFLKIVDDYSEQEEDQEKAKTVKAQILDYCVEQDSVGAPVMLEDISSQVDEQAPKAFADYVLGAQKEPTAEIHTDRNSLKRYMRYFGRDNSLSISFSAERFGQDIQYDPAESSLKIAKLPKSLKAQLSNHFDKTEQH